MDNETLATELIKEIKASSKRWFIAFCIMVVLELCTIVGFMWYITLPIEETTYTQTVDDLEDSDVRQVIGGELDGESKTDSTESTESNEE